MLAKAYLLVRTTIAGALRVLTGQPAREAHRQPPGRPRTPAASAAQAKIPLTVGFANLGTTDFEELRRLDLQAIGPLFLRAVAPEPGKVPPAEVLFLYVTLEPDGTLRGPNRIGIRQVVQSTRARLVVVATDTAPSVAQAAIKQPGPKTANLVFTVSRKGKLLPRFFQRLFGDMRGGTDLLAAWAKLCPPGGAAAPDLPGTLLVAEGGKLAFPAGASA